MTQKRTTTSIDDETYSYLYNIALFKLKDDDKSIFNDIYGIIKLIFDDMESLIDDEHIDFDDPNLLKYIQNTDNPRIFLILTDNNIHILETFKIKMKTHNKKLNIKRNQIIKTMVILYYKLLLKCAK